MTLPGPARTAGHHRMNHWHYATQANRGSPLTRVGSSGSRGGDRINEWRSPVLSGACAMRRRAAGAAAISRRAAAISPGGRGVARRCSMVCRGRGVQGHPDLEQLAGLGGIKTLQNAAKHLVPVTRTWGEKGLLAHSAFHRAIYVASHNDNLIGMTAPSRGRPVAHRARTRRR